MVIVEEIATGDIFQSCALFGVFVVLEKTLILILCLHLSKSLVEQVHVMHPGMVWQIG